MDKEVTADVQSVSVSQQVEKTYHHKLDADDALKYLQAHGVAEITPEEDRRILHKIDLWLMPLVRVV